MKKSLSHTVLECKYHVVWAPKKRHKIIYGKLRKKIVGYLKGKRAIIMFEKYRLQYAKRY